MRGVALGDDVAVREATSEQTERQRRVHERLEGRRRRAACSLVARGRFLRVVVVVVVALDRADGEELREEAREDERESRDHPREVEPRPPSARRVRRRVQKSLVRAEAVARRRRRPRRTVGRTPKRFLTLERTLERFPPLRTDTRTARRNALVRPPVENRLLLRLRQQRRPRGGGVAAEVAPHLRGDGARRGGVRPIRRRDRCFLRDRFRGFFSAVFSAFFRVAPSRPRDVPRASVDPPEVPERRGETQDGGDGWREVDLRKEPRRFVRRRTSSEGGAFQFRPARGIAVASPSSPSSRVARAPFSSPPRGGPRVVREQERVGLLGRPPPVVARERHPVVAENQQHRVVVRAASLHRGDDASNVRVVLRELPPHRLGPDAVRVPRVVHAEEVSDQDVPPLGLGERRVQMPPHALVDEVEVLDVEARERLVSRAEGGARVREQVQPRVVAGEGDAKAHPSGGDVDDVILAQRRAAAETVPDVGEGRKAACEESLEPLLRRRRRVRDEPEQVAERGAVAREEVAEDAHGRRRRRRRGGGRSVRAPGSRPRGGRVPDRPRGAREVESRAVDDEDDRLVHGRARPAPGEPGGGGRGVRVVGRRVRKVVARARVPQLDAREQEPGGERAQPRDLRRGEPRERQRQTRARAPRVGTARRRPPTRGRHRARARKTRA